jgi:beta-hydroxylase
MLAQFLSVKYALLLAFVASAVYVHYRGRVRHRFFRQASDHSTLFAPYNVFMYAFSRVPGKPYLDVAQFPQLAPLAAHWQEIRDEGMALLREGYVRASAKHDDAGFNSFFRTGWKRFYLKWYDEPLPSAREHCPRTLALLRSIPSVTGAMFAMLPPGGRLVRHRDPYAGSLRYHLGLVTPNSPDCYLSVDGETYYWKDGEAVMFDETYIHFAENRTDQQRLILFCDVERPLRSRIMAAINHWVSFHVISGSRTRNVEGEPVGFINRIFEPLYQVRLLGKRIKEKNRTVYYLLKWLLLGGLIYAILR